jgi:hypothetical protein
LLDAVPHAVNSLTHSFPRCTEDAIREYHLGITAFSRREVNSALHHFERAEFLGFNAATCGAYRWNCWMLLGEFENAWRESDRINALGVPDPHALWDGRPFTGNRVLIRCLHGYGDAIQFLRYATLVRSAATRVTVQTHPELVALLSRLPGADSVITWPDDAAIRESWDQQIEVTELPRAFRTTISMIPCKIPYLDVPPYAVSRSRESLGESPRLKVGLLWAASVWNPARSMRLEELVPVLDTADCTFYSFQRGVQRAELMALPARFAVHDTACHSPGIADTAADLLNMDLLITVDTMAAHLAGALGRPVWVMLPWDADWRWMLDREDTPWYPTMRLFRQPAPGLWKPVINRVAAELCSARTLGCGDGTHADPLYNRLG